MSFAFDLKFCPWFGIFWDSKFESFSIRSLDVYLGPEEEVFQINIDLSGHIETLS